MVFTGGTKILFDLGVPVSQIGREKQNNIGEVRAAGFWCRQRIIVKGSIIILDKWFGLM